LELIVGKGIKRKVLENLPDDLRYLAHIAAGRNPGYIYLLVSDDLGLVKIGASNRWDGHTVGVDQRIAEVKNDVPFITINREHVILASVLGLDEAEIHDHFAAYRVAGEWFVYSDDLKIFVDNVGDLLLQLDEWEKNANAHPTATPWKLLKTPPKPPSKKFTGVKAIFE
jgi:hypothetical protein